MEAPDNRQTDDWTAPKVYPVRTREDWEMTMCGCSDCWERNGCFDPMKIPNFGECFKTMARDKTLREKSRERFVASNKKGFRPAKPAQIAEWTAWLSSPELAEAQKRVASIEAAAKKIWETHQWDPVKMEQDLLRFVPDEKKQTYTLTSPAWIAYRAYGHEQSSLFYKYNKILSNCVNTKEDYDEAEKAFKALTAHINKHGPIVMEMPEHKHKMPKEQLDGPKKIGRRAARRLKNASESSSSTLSRSEARSKLVASTQPYAKSDDE
jgi:hypothetical protein